MRPGRAPGLGSRFVRSSLQAWAGVEGGAVGALDGAQPGGEACFAGADDLAVVLAVGAVGEGLAGLAGVAGAGLAFQCADGLDGSLGGGGVQGGRWSGCRGRKRAS